MKFKFITALLIFSSTLVAQKQIPLDIALRHLEKQKAEWQLTENDIADIVVNDQYLSKHNGTSHIYLKQQYAGIEIFNAINGVHIDRSGNVVHVTNRFYGNLAEFINTIAPNLTPQDAILAAIDHLGLSFSGSLQEKESDKGKLSLFSAPEVSKEDIEVQLVYQPITPKDIRLAWQVILSPNNSQDSWNIRIDAADGTFLEKHNYTLYCSFSSQAGHIHQESCELEQQSKTLEEIYQLNEESSSYRVFPFGIESPIHGDRELVNNPADMQASPFGWHDADGEEGADFTITFGNNVHAYLDRNGDFVPDTPEPNGGEDLIFDFPFNPQGEPLENLDAVTTQLFYTSNIMHDFSYAYGFDEAAGNFQLNNYGKGGEEGDYVIGGVQWGADGNPDLPRPLDPQANNATFGTRADGSTGTMRMFVWNSGSSSLTVLSPSSIAGSYNIGTAGFGPSIFDVDISGEVVQAFDNSANPQFACGTIVNAGQVDKKIALVQRGECFFERKTLNAEAAGAIAIIICNRDDFPNGLGGSDTIPDPNIPAISISSSDCQRITARLNAGETVNVEFAPNPPSQLDGSFDNGIVAHEYGHGISIRLTGGPGTGNCLSNAEQMGEGWSDFFTLVTTIQEGDNGSERSAIGNYATRRGLDGGGIRRQPYSTSMNVNNQTYRSIQGQSAPHQRGEVWAAMLWDLYWKFVEIHGWDPDQFRGTGGNNMALQLVMDGMKLQPCNPGYTDGRDAILAADLLNYNGANQCIIWEVFARRGLGWSANQGSWGSVDDGLEAFDIPPHCINEPRISKSVTPLINAGEVINVMLTIRNQTESTLTNVLVTDEIPTGASFVPGSATADIPAQVNGNTIEFTIGNFEPGSVIELTYQLNSAVELSSITQLLDDVEGGNDLWTIETVSGTIPWSIIDTEAFSGSNSWFILNAETESEQILQLREPYLLTGNQPVLRFFHRHDTETAWDGGIVEISTNGGGNWIDANSRIFRNPYSIQMATFSVFGDDAETYSGNSNGFIASYLDLSDFNGQEIFIRFRFLTDQNTGGIGWFLDDFQFIDMFNYEGQACISASGVVDVCAMAESRGTVVEPETAVTSTDDPVTTTLNAKIYPNPVKDLLNIAIATTESTALTIRLLSTDGRVIQSIQQDIGSNTTIIPLSVKGLASGIYFVQLNSERGISTHKIVVR